MNLDSAMNLELDLGTPTWSQLVPVAPRKIDLRVEKNFTSQRSQHTLKCPIECPLQGPLQTTNGSWISVGHTGTCEIEWEPFPAGLVPIRVFIAWPFLVLDFADALTVHHGGFQLDLGSGVLNVSLVQEFQFSPSQCFGPAISFAILNQYVRCQFYNSLDQELRAAEGLGVSPRPPCHGGAGALVSLDEAPSEDFLCALEAVTRRVLGTQGEKDLVVLLPLALVYQTYCQFGFGQLEPLLQFSGLKEIMVNGPDEIYIESSLGLRRVAGGFFSRLHFERLVSSLLERMESRLDLSHPVAQGVLRECYRVHIVSKQICETGPCLTIRCFPSKTFALSELLGDCGRNSGLLQLLVSLVKGRKNILVSGETSSGKTSLIEALSEYFCSEDRVVVVEDVRELRLAHRHSVYLKTQQGFGPHVPEIDLRTLVKESLRMRPDRLIIGECRGGESLDLLQALNTGHAGSLTSVHGSSAGVALKRLETLALFGQTAITRETAASLLGTAIDFVVHMKRGPGGERFVDTVVELVREHSQMQRGAHPKIVEIYRVDSLVCRPVPQLALAEV